MTIWNLKYSVTKFVREQKKIQLKYYEMIVYALEYVLAIINILKVLPCNGINNYMKTLSSALVVHWSIIVSSQTFLLSYSSWLAVFDNWPMHY